MDKDTPRAGGAVDPGTGCLLELPGNNLAIACATENNVEIVIMVPVNAQEWGWGYVRQRSFVWPKKKIQRIQVLKAAGNYIIAYDRARGRGVQCE